MLKRKPRRQRSPSSGFTAKQWLTLARQIGTVLLALAGALGSAKVGQESGQRGSQDASQNQAIYIQMTALQRQVDSLKWALRRVEGRRKQYRFITEDDVFGPPAPVSQPPRARRWLAALGHVLTGG